MRPLALFLAFVLTGCTPVVERAPTPSQPAIALLSDPVADSRLLGRLHTVGDMRRLAPISEVKIDGDLNTDWAAPITEGTLERLLTAGKPVGPYDKLIDAWHYAPWCSASFLGGGRKWSVALYLGGLGVITDDAGRQGAFRFDAAPSDGR